MASTEDTIRASLVTIIEGIAQADLGFDFANGNVKEYFHEFEEDEKQVGYFSADIDSGKQARVWAVQVVATDEPKSLLNRQREYNVTLRGYYEKKAGVNTAITHSRKVRDAVLDELEDSTSSIYDGGNITGQLITSDPFITTAPDKLDGRELITIEITFTLEEDGPGY